MRVNGDQARRSSVCVRSILTQCAWAASSHRWTALSPVTARSGEWECEGNSTSLVPILLRSDPQNT